MVANSGRRAARCRTMPTVDRDCKHMRAPVHVSNDMIRGAGGCTTCEQAIATVRRYQEDVLAGVAPGQDLGPLFTAPFGDVMLAQRPHSIHLREKTWDRLDG